MNSTMAYNTPIVNFIKLKIKNIGDFRHYSSTEAVHLNYIYMPVLKSSYSGLQIIDVSESKIETITPGFLDISNNFIEFALEIHYVKLKKALIIESHTPSRGCVFSLELDIEVYSIDFKSFECLTVNIQSNNIVKINTMAICNVVNLVNLFIASGRELKCLDVNKFQDCLIDKYFSIYNVNSCVDSLKFEYNDWYISRVGKDDLEGTKVTVTNLPDTKYLKKLIAKSLSATYLPSSDSIRFEGGSYHTQEKKIRIKTDLASWYNSQEEKLTFLEK